MNKHNFLFIDDVYYDRHGKPLHGATLYNAEAKHLNGGLKQTFLNFIKDRYYEKN